jgi:hypothetical protein
VLLAPTAVVMVAGRAGAVEPHGVAVRAAPSGNGGPLGIPWGEVVRTMAPVSMAEALVGAAAGLAAARTSAAGVGAGLVVPAGAVAADACDSGLAVAVAVADAGAVAAGSADRGALVADGDGEGDVDCEGAGDGASGAVVWPGAGVVSSAAAGVAAATHSRITSPTYAMGRTGHAAWVWSVRPTVRVRCRRCKKDP